MLVKVLHKQKGNRKEKYIRSNRCMLARLSKIRYLCLRVCCGAFSWFSRPEARHCRHKSNPSPASTIELLEEEDAAAALDCVLWESFVTCFCET